jgi:hypothetical protein
MDYSVEVFFLTIFWFRRTIQFDTHMPMEGKDGFKHESGVVRVRENVSTVTNTKKVIVIIEDKP